MRYYTDIFYAMKIHYEYSYLVWIWEIKESHPSTVSSIILCKLQTCACENNSKSLAYNFSLSYLLAFISVQQWIELNVEALLKKKKKKRKHTHTHREPVITPKNRLTNLGGSSRQMKNKWKCVSVPVISHFWKVL